MSLSTKPLHPLFAAEVSGVQVCDPMDDATYAQIRAEFEKYSVLVFPGQHITDEGHIAFAERFGRLETTSKSNPGKGSLFARQSNLDIESGGVIPPGDKRLVYAQAARLWHTDSSFRMVPALCSVLSGHIVPPEGANTEFASARAAYRELPDDIKQRIENQVAEHSQAHSLSLIDPALATPEIRRDLPPVYHPLVRVNPVSGEKAVYVGAHVARILGWPLQEGRALLRELTDFVTQPRFVYSHKWTAGDILMWDNRAVLHRATPYDNFKYKRLLLRATVACDQALYLSERVHLTAI
jgi:alpha-ketoglutarate-dependent 2,4-dichlorophenoxyacetate dioxygenase